MSSFEYKVYGKTDRGLRHEVNQDSFIYKAASFNKERIIFALVADGMGGTGKGEEASRTLADAFTEWFSKDLGEIVSEERNYGEELVAQWQRIIEEVNRKLNNLPHVLNEYDLPEKRPGTTLVMILLHGGIFFAANIGDSRIYKEEGGELFSITKDHSFVQRELDKGTPIEIIKESPHLNALTKCIGAELTDTPKVDYQIGEYSDGDAFLLCTDGFWHYNQNNSELSILLSNENVNTKDAASTLINYARDMGEEDDITAVIIKVKENAII